MSLKAPNKGVAWLYSEVCALLDIWADQEIQQQLAGRLHNMCIYDKISKRLLDLGIDRTGEQCREKIKKLRRDYKTVVDNNYSPAFARKLLGCYDKVHEIFGKCSVLKPSFVIESIIYNDNIENAKSEVIADESPLNMEISQQEDKPITQNEFSNHPAKLVDLPDLLIDNKKCSTGNKLKLKFKRNKLSVFQRRRNKSIEQLLKKQAILQEKLSKRHNTLHKKFIDLERKRFSHELLEERKRLLDIEVQRRKDREQELKLFTSLLNTIGSKDAKNFTQL